MGERYAGKVVVVTGAGGGIGRAAAIRFASEGARVVAVDFAPEPLAETMAAIEQTGDPGLAVQADVSRSADFARVADKAMARFGGVDCCFNNAGILGPIASILQYPEEMFDQVLAVNAKGVWLGIKVLAPLIRTRGGGAIVNTASIGGLVGSPYGVAYSASKHAVIGITKSAAKALAGDSIRVNAICPGMIETPMLAALEEGINPANPSETRQNFTKGIPLDRYGTPEEVAALVAFLCSPDAAYITGAAFTIDGGRLA